MTPPRTTPAQRGRNATAKGKRFNRDCALKLRELGWPHADVIPSNERGDIGGVGDINVECKDHADWRDLAAHIRQTMDDAAARGLPDSIVWKKRVGYADPMSGYIVIAPRVFWSMRRRMEELETTDAEYQRLLERVAEAVTLEVRGEAS
jgi:hypothetical protein